MADLHIDDFYRDAAKILVSLYAHFPRKTMVTVEDICGPDNTDEFGLHSPRHEACFHTLLWLAHTDYLHFEQTVRQEALDQVVLSHRGFLLLNAQVGNKEDETLMIYQLRQELKVGTSDSLADLMRRLLAESRRFG